jgi:hypothetical protein
MKPRWLTRAMNEGKQPNDFLIAAHDEGQFDGRTRRA